MKKLLIASLLLTTTLSQAATLVLEDVPGLHKGNFNLDCTYERAGMPGIYDHFKSSGMNNPPHAPPGYGLAGALQFFNEIIADPEVNAIDYSLLSISCGNQKKVDYHFTTEQVKAPGTITIKAPIGCA